MMTTTTERKEEVLTLLKETNRDLFREYSLAEVLDLVDGIIEAMDREIQNLTNSGVPHYEALYEASKLQQIDTPYSILNDYLTDRPYSVDPFCEDYQESVLTLSHIHREKLLEGDFDQPAFHEEMEKHFS
jgi:hypothetical protein